MDKGGVTLESINNEVCNIKSTVEDLYNKVIRGNGKSPLATRVEVMDSKMKDLENNGCSRGREVMDKVNKIESDLQTETIHIRNSIDGIKETLDNITGEKKFKGRVLYRNLISAVKTIAVSAVTASCFLLFDYISGDNNQDPDQTRGSTVIEENIDNG